jgi:hypothetical protein
MLSVVSVPVPTSTKQTSQRAVLTKAALLPSGSVQERVQQKLRERLEEKQQKAKSSAMKADGSQSELPLLSSLGSSSSSQSILDSAASRSQTADGGDNIVDAIAAADRHTVSSSPIPVSIAGSVVALESKQKSRRMRTVLQLPRQQPVLMPASSSVSSPNSRVSAGNEIQSSIRITELKPQQVEMVRNSIILFLFLIPSFKIMSQKFSSSYRISFSSIC